MTTLLDPSDVRLFGSFGDNTTDPIYSDGIIPKKFWVSPNGTNGDANGTPQAPFLTIAFALTKCATGRGDTIFVGPGSYAETLDISVANVAIIGTGGRHNGITQIIGNGSTAQPTVRVTTGAAGGFRLKNVELDTNGLSQPALEIITSDTGAATATAAFYRFLIEDVAVRSNDPNIGVLLSGATLGILRRLTINGPTVAGIAFTGSPSNMPSDLLFEDIDIFNGFSTTTTADVTMVISNSAVNSGFNTIGGINLTNVLFKRVNFGSMSTGAGGSTNYINFSSGATTLNVGFYDCRFGTAPTSGTNKIATLPTNCVVLGHGTSGLVSLKG